MRILSLASPLVSRGIPGHLVAMLAFLLSTSPASADAPSYELPLTADFNQDGVVDIMDVQCAANMTLWTLAGDLGPAPGCAGDLFSQSDVNCDNEVNITDFVLTIESALDLPLSPELDGNGDGQPDACALDVICAGDKCDNVRAFDLDQDGNVTTAEWFEYTGFLDTVDDNGDGIVTTAEYLNGADSATDEGPMKQPLEDEEQEEAEEDTDTNPSTQATGNSRTSGGNSRTSGGNSRTSGGNSRVSGGNGQTSGGNGGYGGGNVGTGGTGGTGGGGTGGGMGGTGGDPVCDGNYDMFDFPKVWLNHPDECVPAPGDPAIACTQSFTEFCDTNDDGIVDDDKRGAGVTLCGPGYACGGDGMGGTPVPCPCAEDGAVTPPPFPAPDPNCPEFKPTSPPPPGPGESPLGAVPGACDFYGAVIQNPGGCSEHEKTLIGGYHQTCLNVTNGVGTTPSGAMCDLVTDWREYVDGLRYCLQEEVTNEVTIGKCLKPWLSCSEVVQEIADAHEICNAEQDFCDVMQNPDVGYCFGLGIGDAWGAILVGTTPLGPLAPLGPFQGLTSILTCGLAAPTVQDNICAGYRVACNAAAGPGTVPEALCRLACPYSWEILTGDILPWPLNGVIWPLGWPF